MDNHESKRGKSSDGSELQRIGVAQRYECVLWAHNLLRVGDAEGCGQLIIFRDMSDLLIPLLYHSYLRILDTIHLPVQ